MSHDFRLIGQVAHEIWEVAGGTVKKWEGSIESYKDHLRFAHQNLSKREIVER